MFGTLDIATLAAATVGTTLDPLAAHITALFGINGAGRYLLAEPNHYAASLTQAGIFSDAFSGDPLYEAPNVQASPTAVQDPTSGLWYVSADGADDTAVGYAAETVAAWTGLIRCPNGHFNDLSSVFDCANNNNADHIAGIFYNGTQFYVNDPVARPRGVRRNGTDLASPFDLSPVTAWQIITVRCANPAVSRLMAMFMLSGPFCWAGHLAALRTWPTDPSDSVVAATETEMARYFGPLIATNP